MANSNDEVKVRIKIDSNTKELILMSDEVRKLGTAFNNADSFANRFVKNLDIVGKSYLGLQLFNNSLGQIVSKGVEVNKAFQDLTNSLTLSSVAVSSNTSSLGKNLNIQEKYKLATIEAKKSLELLNKATINTHLSFAQNVKIYDTLYLGFRKAGAGISDMVNITEKLAIATNGKVNFNSLIAGVDGLASGTVLANSDLGRFLNSIGLTNEALKTSSDVVALVNSKLSSFESLESYTSKVGRLNNSFSIFSQELMKIPFSFVENKIDGVSSSFEYLTKEVTKVNEYFSSSNKNIINEALILGSAISGVALGFKGVSKAIALYKDVTAKAIIETKTFSLATGTLTTKTTQAKTSILAKATALRTLSLALKTLPFALVTTAVYYLTSAFVENRKNADLLNNVYSGIKENLENLTLAQLKYKSTLLNDEWVKLYNEYDKLLRKIRFTKDENKKLELTALKDDIKVKLDQLREEKSRIEEQLQKNNNPKAEDSLKTDYSEQIAQGQKLIKEVLDPMGVKIEQIKDKYKKYFDLYKKEGLDTSNLQKALNKELADLSDKTKQISNNKEFLNSAKIELSYYERLVQLKQASYEKEIQLANIDYSKRNIDIASLDKPIEQKNRLLDLETQIYNTKLQNLETQNKIDNLDSAKTSYNDMLNSQIELLDATAQWNNNLSGVSGTIANISSATASLSKLELTNKKEQNKLSTQYEKDKIKYSKDTNKLKQLDIKYSKDKALLDKKNLSSQLLGYSNIAGAIGSMYEQGSQKAALFQSAQSALALVEGTRAILTAGTGDPYTAIPRMIAMTAMVSSLLSSINVAFGGSKISTSNTYDDFSKIKANDGTGSSLGDKSKTSESIKNSLNILEDFAKPQYQVLSSMNYSLKSIESKISGVTKIILANSSFAQGGGFSPFDTGYKNKISSNGLLDIGMGLAIGGVFGGLGTLAQKLNIPVLKNIGGFVNKSIGKILGGVFGRKKVSQSLEDSGIAFDGMNLQTALKGLNAKQYQTIKTTTTKKRWLGSSKVSNSYNSYFEDLDNESKNQFTLILNSLYDGILSSASAFDTKKEELEQKLANFKVDIGKISLKDKSAQQIQELLGNVFSKLGDDLAKASIPLLSEFQAIGEGMFETLSRVAVGINEARFYIKKLGVDFSDISYKDIIDKQGNVGFEGLYQSIKKYEDSLYPVNNSLLDIISNLKISADELYSVYNSLDNLRHRLEYLKHDIQGLSSSMISGAGSLEVLQDGFKSYFEHFLSSEEQLEFNTQALEKSFKALNLELPNSKDSFKKLLDEIDLTSQSGQELYGSLISLSGAFAKLTEETEDLNNLKLNEFISNMDKISSTLKSLKDTALSFVNSFNSSDDDIKQNLITYNKKRKEFDSYFENGELKKDVDLDKVKTLYSSLSDVGKTLSKQDGYLKDRLVNIFEQDIEKFDFANDVLKVKIVDGLGDLLKINTDNLIAFKDLLKKESITKLELENLGLEENSLNKILELLKGKNILLPKLNSFAVGSTNIEYDQLAHIHKQEMIIPKNFSQGLRDGNLSLGDNKEVVKAIVDLTNISIQGFNELRRLRKEFIDYKEIA